MRLSLSARKTAQYVSVRCSRLGCPGSARYETICAGPAYCVRCWRRYLVVRAAQFVFISDRTRLWWWHTFASSADDVVIALVLKGLRTQCSVDLIALVDDIDRRTIEQQIAEIL